MKKQLAFVLSGGGARGALQVGALRALIQAGYLPDLVTGTSIGAANAAFLAVHGFSTHGIEKLEEVWQATVDQAFLPTNLWWQTMRVLFGRSQGHTLERIREFAIANGISPNLKFGDIHNVRLYLVAADLNAGAPVIFGQDLNESVLDGVLASIALPPWMTPQVKDGRYLMDGAAVSNLPIQAALRQGATGIIALDLMGFNEGDPAEPGLRSFISKLDRTVESRETELEIELAEARGVHVRRMLLTAKNPVPIWDFRRSLELMKEGYELGQQAIEAWQVEEHPSWWRKIGVKMLGGVLDIIDQ